jgi:hypothetical protein
MRGEKEPLYRKVNTTARAVVHFVGGDAKDDRNTKKGTSEKMSKNKQRGLDYTPLFRFLISKVGQDFDTVFSEAVSRLDKEEPIWYIVVDPNEQEILLGKRTRGYVACGNGTSFYSQLYVDDRGLLQLVDPSIRAEDFAQTCSCCTYTFNGKQITKKYDPNRPNSECYPKEPVDVVS